MRVQVGGGRFGSHEQVAHEVKAEEKWGRLMSITSVERLVHDAVKRSVVFRENASYVFGFDYCYKISLNARRRANSDLLPKD